MLIFRKFKVHREREEYINNVIVLIRLRTRRQTLMAPHHSSLLQRYQGKIICRSTSLLLFGRRHRGYIGGERCQYVRDSQERFQDTGILGWTIAHM